MYLQKQASSVDKLNKQARRNSFLPAPMSSLLLWTWWSKVVVQDDFRDQEPSCPMEQPPWCPWEDAPHCLVGSHYLCPLSRGCCFAVAMAMGRCRRWSFECCSLSTPMLSYCSSTLLVSLGSHLISQQSSCTYQWHPCGCRQEQQCTPMCQSWSH